MATKKATAKKTSTSAKKAPSKPATTTKVTSIKANPSPAKAVAAPVAKTEKSRRVDNNVVNLVLAELIGTFILVLVALLTFKETLPLYVGLTLVVLVLTIGAVSGSHVNPAVTFGLWTARKLKSILVPFYWGAQFLGAMAAVVVMNMVAGSQKGLDFSHFTEFSLTIMFIELIGTAVFLFGLTSVLNRADVSVGGKALGIGLSLGIGLLVSSSLLAPAQSQAIADYQKKAADGKTQPKIPHQLYVGGATLNPAVALAATETTESELRGTQAGADEKAYTRLSLEVIVGTLAGAAIGANLALLLGYRFKI